MRRINEQEEKGNPYRIYRRYFGINGHFKKNIL